MPPVAFLLQDTGAIYGAQRATVDLLRGLREDGRISPVVFLLEETRLGLARSDFRAAIQSLGVEIETLPVNSAYAPEAVRTLRGRLQDREISVLHTVGPKADLHGWLAAGRGVRQISTVHGWLFRADAKERFHEALNRWVLRRCDRVIVLSRYYETRLLQSGVCRERLVRIPSGFAGPHPPAPTGTPEYAAGWMGRFSEEKQPEIFLEALALAAPRLPGARFVLAGDGHLRDSLRARAQALGLADRVDWPGYHPREVFFARVGVLVMTSKIENLPYTILEAMSSRRPVLATGVGGIPDLVEDGRTGFLVPPGEAAALADRLVDLAQNPARAAALGEAGHAKLLREFTVPAMVEAMVRVYEA